MSLATKHRLNALLTIVFLVRPVDPPPIVVRCSNTNCKNAQKAVMYSNDFANVNSVTQQFEALMCSERAFEHNKNIFLDVQKKTRPIIFQFALFSPSYTIHFKTFLAFNLGRVFVAGRYRPP